MIRLSRLHDAGSIVVNADLIETIEACPDTTITLITKRKLLVSESLDEAVARVVEFRRSIAIAGSAPAYHPRSTHEALQQRAA